MIIFLAFLVFILSFQLLITRSADRIRKLKWLGYDEWEISKPYLADLGMIMAGLSALTAIMLVLLKNRFSAYVSDWGMELTHGINASIAIGGILLVILMFVLNAAAIVHQARKIR